MTHSKKNYLFNIIILVLSVSMLNGFNKSIYLPKIPIYIPPNAIDYLDLDFKKELNNHPVYTVMNKSRDSFYSFSIQNTKNKHKSAWGELLITQIVTIPLGLVVFALFASMDAEEEEEGAGEELPWTQDPTGGGAGAGGSYGRRSPQRAARGV